MPSGDGYEVGSVQHAPVQANADACRSGGQAHRSQQGAIVEAIAEEAIRTRTFPGISFRGVDWDRRAWVIGTGLDVWQIVDAYRDIGSIESMVEGGSANERQIRLALDYYERFPEEIDAAIAENRRPVEQLEEEFPFAAVSRVEA
jgi:uncharacterized protein (DUF433 family)